MRIKVTLYGCQNITPPVFFDREGRFHRDLNIGLQIVFGRDTICEQLDWSIESREVVVPQLNFAEFVFQYEMGDVEQLRQLAAQFGYSFCKHVRNDISPVVTSPSAFVGVRVSDGIHVVSWPRECVA